MVYFSFDEYVIFGWKNKRRQTWLLLKHGDDFYCRHNRKSRLREVSRLNKDGRLNRVLRGEGGGTAREKPLIKRDTWTKRPRYSHSQNGRVI